MTGKKKKFSYYNDYSTVNFGGSSSRKRERSNEGRSRSGREHNWCADCSGSGECSHCKGGFYPRRDGSNAPCGKCRGGQKCHACRGSRLDGKKCGTPTYEKTVERLRNGGSKGTKSTWTPRASQPPDVGVVAGTDHVASFKAGGPSGEETLIADGDYSSDNEGFRQGHDHHGPKGSKRRGKYTGPGN